MRQIEQLRYLVLAAQREGNRVLVQSLTPLGLTPSQAEVLRILGDHEPMTLSGLGAMLVCESGTNPSRLVDRLVVAGLVERLPDAGDRRQVTLTLTERGRECELHVKAIEQELYGGLDAALDELDAGPLLLALQRLTAGSPSGDALRARIGAE